MTGTVSDRDISTLSTLSLIRVIKLGMTNRLFLAINFDDKQDLRLLRIRLNKCMLELERRDLSELPPIEADEI